MLFTQEQAEIIKNGGIGVIPTDTLYGIVASVFRPESVEKNYELKHRQLDKASIVLIADISYLADFGVELDEHLRTEFKNYWPGPYSIVLPCAEDSWKYIHRGLGTIAFRVPDFPELREFLKQTGPIIAPSANIEGLPPATNIAEAQKYFSDEIDFYVDGGELNGKPSSVIVIEEGHRIKVLR